MDMDYFDIRLPSPKPRRVHHVYRLASAILALCSICLLGAGNVITDQLRNRNLSDSAVPDVSSVKSTATTTTHSSTGPALRTIVLTFDRSTSLERLLHSLAKANYGTDRIDLDIWIDRPDNEAPDANTVLVASEFEWPAELGVKTVHIWPRNAGLKAQWTQTWNASIIASGNDEGLSEDTTERVVILEDDLEVSPHYWTWLKAAHDAYGCRPDIAGVTLQRAELCAGKCPNLQGGLRTGSTNFLYPVVGSWGYSPSARHWVRFNKWLVEFEQSKEEPLVNGILPTEWYQFFKRQGRCPGKRCMWTIYHLKYTDTHEDHLSVYVRAPRGETMAVNWKETGLHYGHGLKKSSDHPLVLQWSDKLVDFVNEPTVLTYRGVEDTKYKHPNPVQVN